MARGRFIRAGARRIGHADVVELRPLPLELLEEIARDPSRRIHRGRRRGSGGAARPGSLAIEAGGDDGDLDFFAESFVEARAENDVRFRVGRGADFLGGLSHLEQRQVGAARHVEQDALGASDVDLEERAGDGLPRGLDGANSLRWRDRSP